MSGDIRNTLESTLTELEQPNVAQLVGHSMGALPDGVDIEEVKAVAREVLSDGADGGADDAGAQDGGTPSAADARRDGGQQARQQLGFEKTNGDLTRDIPDTDWRLEDAVSDEFAHIVELYDSKEEDNGEARRMVVDQLGGSLFGPKDGDNHFVALAGTDELYRYNPRSGIYEPNGEDVVGAVLDAQLGPHYSIQEKREITERLKDRHRIDREEMGGPPGKVCVANGVLDVSDPSDPELLDFDPEYHFLRSFNVRYDPDADCPQFKAFIGQVCRPEDIKKLQEYAGYALHTWGQPFKKALAILGPTDAGKGVFLRILRDIIGEENVATETLYSINATRWGTASLYGKIVNIANELAEGGLQNAETFKTITGGGDQITAERKGQDPFTFTPTAKHLFATNQVPEVNDADEAFYNRWLFVTFPETVPPERQIPDLGEKIVASEAPGILNWMLEGYARLMAQGKFSDERFIDEKADMWAEHGGTVERFIQNYMEITHDPEDQIARKDLYAAYTRFCKEDGVAPELQATLTKELTKESVQKGQSRSAECLVDQSKTSPRVFRGAKLTDEGWAYLDELLTKNGDNDSSENVAKKGLNDYE